MKKENNFSLALRKGDESLLKPLKRLINPKSHQNFTHDSKKALNGLSKYIENFVAIEKLKGPLKFILALILIGHVHILQSLNQHFWETLVSVSRGVRKKGKVSIFQDDFYEWNLKWMCELVWLMAVWLPKDFYDNSKQSLYLLTVRKYQMKEKPIEILTPEYLQKLQVDLELHKFQSQEICRFCYKCRQEFSKENQQKNIGRLSLLSDPLKKRMIQNQKSLNRLKIIQDQYGINQFKGNKSELKQNTNKNRKDLLSTQRSMRLLEKFKLRKSKRKESAAPKSPKMLLPKQNMLYYSESSPHLPLHTSESKLQRQESRLKLRHLSPTFSELKKRKMEENLEYQPYSMFQKTISCFFSDEQEKFKRNLANLRSPFIEVKRNVNIKINVHDGLLGIQFNNKVGSYRVIEPVQNVKKEKKDKKLIIFDFMKEPRIVKVQIDKEEVVIPIGYLRLLQERQQIQEWEVEKSHLTRRIFMNKHRTIIKVQQIGTCLNMKKIKSNSSLVEKYEQIFSFCDNAIKLSVQSIGACKILLRGWCKNQPQIVSFVEKVLSEIIFCFS